MERKGLDRLKQDLVGSRGAHAEEMSVVLRLKAIQCTRALSWPLFEEVKWRHGRRDNRKNTRLPGGKEVEEKVVSHVGRRKTVATTSSRLPFALVLPP